jgi:hypothetical protein
MVNMGFVIWDLLIWDLLIWDRFEMFANVFLVGAILKSFQMVGESM